MPAGLSLGLFCAVQPFRLAPNHGLCLDLTRSQVRSYGSGPQHFRKSVVALLWPVLWVFRSDFKGLRRSTTPQREKPLSHVCVHAQARTCSDLCVVGVVALCLFLNSLKDKEKKKEKATTLPTTLGQAGVVDCPKPLKSLKKGGFARG